MRIMKKCLWLVLVVIALLCADRARADEKLCKHVSAIAAEYKLDERVFMGILMVESDLKLSAVNERSHDYGIGQINKFTQIRFGFSKVRLTTDLKYSLRASAHVLKDFERMYGKREPLTWMCRYNVGAGKLRSAKLKNCIKYLNRLAVKELPKCKNEQFSSITLR